RARQLDLLDPGDRLEARGDGPGDGPGGPEQGAAEVGLGALEGFQDVLLELLAETRQVAQLPGPRRLLQLGAALDPEVVPDQAHPLGAEALDGGELEQSGWALPPHLLEPLGRSGLREVADLAPRVVTD